MNGVQNTDVGFTAFRDVVNRVMFTQRPFFKGVAHSLGYHASSGDIYGVRLPQSEYIYINHQFYLYGYARGIYTFEVKGKTDDVVLLWTEKHATDVPRFEYAMMHDSFYGQVRTKYAQIMMEQGQFVPVRIISANCAHPMEFEIIITGPGGKVLTSPQVCSPYIVTHICGQPDRFHRPLWDN